MNKEAQLLINNLASRYITTGDDAVFSSMYKTLADELRMRLKYWSETIYLAESHDVTSMFDDAILKTVCRLQTDGHGEFVKLFNTILNNDYRSLMRRIRTKRKYEDLDDGSGEISKQLVVDNYEEIKTDADKLQLINVLTDETDPLTTAIVNEYLSNGLTKPTAIGEKLGIHHSKVSRQLRKLAKKYNERQSGDINAYLVC